MPGAPDNVIGWMNINGSLSIQDANKALPSTLPSRMSLPSEV
jgi:hypothetical protein